MTAFERLHPAVQYHIVNSLGWRNLRPLQERSIDPILDGHNTLCLAPTAGGKTEAAIFPLLSKMLSSNRQGLAILYVCPIKALLNNLFHRLRLYADYVGRRVALWHGDIQESEKRRILRDPPDILLTTPESIELLLISLRTQPQRLFAGLFSVVVDELHAFAGFDRGWQLLLLIERLAGAAGNDLQRIGLSATVGNPADMLQWLSGSSQHPRSVVEVDAEGLPDPEVVLDFVGGLANAAMVISRLHRGEKRLVFCDSRRQTEELAYELRALGVSTFVSHSSLSIEARRHAEQAFAEGANCVIVATSTLELGIDVGDLDRVIQIEAPYTVASFLQRLGRTGRRAGTTRNCLFLATTREGFLRAGALIELWRRGYVEPVVPPPYPVNVLAQQILALCLQDGRLTETDLIAHFQRILPLTAFLEEGTVEALLEHMLQHGYLTNEHGLIAIGPATEKAFGKRHYLELLSVFEAQSTYQVRFGKADIGQIQSRSLHTLIKEFPYLTLAGRSWHVNHVDDKKRLVFVEPSEIKGKSRWFGAGQSLSFAFCQSIKEFVTLDEAPEYLSARARELLDGVKSDFAWVQPEGTTLLIQEGQPTWWTFAGYRANRLAVNKLNQIVEVKRATDCSIRLSECADPQALPDAMRSALQEDGCCSEVEAEPGKFAVLIPGALQKRQAALNLLDVAGFDAVTAQGVRIVWDRGRT